MMKQSICIIPARGGSKRIKNKNIKNFHKKPLIYYSINCAKKTKLFDNIYVSTDSKKIQKISKGYGAVCEYLRSKKLSNDRTPIFDVIKNFTNKIKINFKYLICIFPATPMIDYKDILKGFRIIYKNKKIDLIIPVSLFNSHPYRSLIINKEKLVPFDKKYFKKNSNYLPEVFFDVGSFYIFRKEFILKSNAFFPSNAYPLIIKKNKYIDINDKEDLKMANKIFKNS